MRYLIIKEKAHQKLIEHGLQQLTHIKNMYTDGDDDILAIDMAKRKYTYFENGCGILSYSQDQLNDLDIENLIRKVHD